MSTFAVYMIGFIMIIGGLAYGAYRLGAPQIWILIGSIILLGLGLTTGASRTRHRDPSDAV
jgi:uncharacterized membrane protein HdeD (DUF308 family)